ncbi:MAG: hypothetical protein A2365_02370 [Candidatus Nealsonbacteria bacterium RIFOXYB1_FULL_40_15]|uniref:PEP-utilising enzyme mobile domain-containing protein n=2 Tax=Candidatus Nealsoniibacteriota TaxID=1817911 RepID=A0A1G2EP99_9BACT|nr:MAG: hypothetical protein A2365_02370 [Candidatus Nealsonbacteria bacterium RIFOXYB1_FULL_40_15]OGZ27634.1 MAG: hypothetical protein A2427_02695 [Candidatus Nealsonbacteria bacterium RIFOXYC1_FULL_40_7]OGZ28680.1 MAG: hypothetical protein A2562_00505 [Candidatus Nealsonbacteria bacterium RIFOXYD1_FULL_39_11]
MYKLIFDRDRVYLFPWYFADEALTHDIADIFGKKVGRVILEFKNGRFYYYSSVDEYNAMGELLLEKVKNDRKFYKTVQKNILKTGEELTEFGRKMNKTNLKKASNQELVDIYETYAKKLKAMRNWGWVPALLDGAATYFLSDYVQAEFKKQMKERELEEKTAEYFTVLSSPEDMSEVQKEEMARLKLIGEIEKKYGNASNVLNSIQDYPDILDKIRRHAKEFEWLPFAYIGPTWDEKGVINSIKDSLNKKETVKEQIEKIKKHYKELPAQKKEIIKKAKLSKDLQYLFGVYSFFMFLKDMRKGIYQKSYVAMEPVINEIAIRIGLTNQEAKYLTGEEIKSALTKEVDFKTVAEERSRYCIALIEDGRTRFLNDSEIDEIKKQLVKDEFSADAKEIKGMIAFAGKVQGIARIIEVVKDIPKLQEGEVLVSPATNPDLVPAMKKASAFVTDTGGVTCHAAIVSRELKKPCVIGTKFATKAIKDGDLVEVDAERGIVTILKRHE